ncbi:hypothetical protein [Sphingomonas sp. Leaf208]|uniref:hypothetical protein n=1 Tax=Sphingomonas sp. Leaf208 TaxID=1735679 RepID=UPI000A50A86C|nr:hypothetical protein [Sphingomonas sp. Leaf208]
MTNAIDKVERYLEDADMLDAPGAVLYSSAETVQSGAVYLLGLNPGGEGEWTLRDNLASARKGKNAYLDEAWENRKGTYGCGRAPLQLRVVAVCKQLGIPVRNVPASNLVFTRSRDVGAHKGFQAAISLCAPVHTMLLQTIQPKLLFTFGSIDWIKKAANSLVYESKKARHGSWDAHRGRIKIFGQDMQFANVPHMSYWHSTTRTDVVDWAIGKS